MFEVESPDGRRLALKVFRQEKEGRMNRIIREAMITDMPIIMEKDGAFVIEDGGLAIH